MKLVGKMQGNTNETLKTLHLEIAMYQTTKKQLRFENFYLPFSGKLDPNNRWAKLT
jgi:hypothetical protein